ncbi:MAG: SCO family protein [Marmoricola sp.]
MRRLVPLLLFAGVLLAGCGEAPAAETVTDRHGYHGTSVDPPLRVPSSRLVDDHGRAFDLAHDGDALHVVFFGYTHCPDICQVVMGTIASAYDRLSEAEQQRVRVMFVSTDPARDTGPRLRAYLARFDTEFTGVRGPLAEVVDLARPLGIYVRKGERLPSGGYEVDHGTHVIAVSGNRAPLLWSAEVSPADLATDIQRLLAGQPAGQEDAA